MFTLSIDQELQLALVQPSFATKYLAIVSAEREYLSQWLAWPPLGKDEAFFLAFIKQSLHDYAEGKSLTCAMLFQGQIVGNISFNSIDNQLKKVEIGYWLSESYQGRGIVTRSVSRLIEYAFTQLQMEKIQISAGEGNRASRAVCERLYMRLEGIITRDEKVGDRIIDHAIYGLNRSEWAKSNI